MKRTLATAALLLGLLTLSACGSADSPAPADPLPSASPSKAGPVEPTMPGQATFKSKQGIRAFVRYFWQIVNYAEASLDTSTLRKLQSESCGTCTAGANWIDSVRRAGGQIRGVQNRVVVNEVLTPDSPPVSAAVSVTAHASGGRVVNAGKLNERFAPGTSTVSMTVNFIAGGWTVTSWKTR